MKNNSSHVNNCSFLLDFRRINPNLKTMAWRSSGANHNALIDNLKRHGLIISSKVESAFRSVDRKLFVPEGHEEYAYLDQPIKDGDIHISAPHIYATIVESLELEEADSLSFLNIGSGTGYLSCIISQLLGVSSLHYGVEISQNVVTHSAKCISRWACSTQPPCTHPIEIIHGNGLQIDSEKGEGRIGFDRIYVGACVGKSDLTKFTQLLRPGGIMVAPVDDELVKIVRVPSLRMDSLMDQGTFSDDHSSRDFVQQTISGVRFAPLQRDPSMYTNIPAKIWSPHIHVHRMYPKSFQAASKEIMLCSRASYVQSRSRRPPVNLSAKLPAEIWTYIFSFTDRTWFQSDQSNLQLLKKRLELEQANTVKAERARAAAEARCIIAERERDLYKLIIRRIQSRLRDEVVREHGSSGPSDVQVSLLQEIVHGYPPSLDQDQMSWDESSNEDGNDLHGSMIDDDDVEMQESDSDTENENSNRTSRPPRTVSISNDEI